MESTGEDKQILLGITGTNGAGKSELARYFKEHHNFDYISARNYLNGELRKRGVTETRQAMHDLANEIRHKEGPAGLFTRMLSVAKNLKNHVVIESVRCPGEISVLVEHGGFLLAVDANIELRYERTVVRGSSTDKVSFEKFVELEELEANSTDPAEQNNSACIQQAHAVFYNESTLEDLYKQVESSPIMALIS